MEWANSRLVCDIYMLQFLGFHISQKNSCRLIMLGASKEIRETPYVFYIFRFSVKRVYAKKLFLFMCLFQKSYNEYSIIDENLFIEIFSFSNVSNT